MSDNKYIATSGYDVELLRQAQRVIRRYRNISSVTTGDALTELERVIGLIESAPTPTRQANADSTENEDSDDNR